MPKLYKDKHQNSFNKRIKNEGDLEFKHVDEGKGLTTEINLTHQDFKTDDFGSPIRRLSNQLLETGQNETEGSPVRESLSKHDKTKVSHITYKGKIDSDKRKSYSKVYEIKSMKSASASTDTKAKELLKK
jgi:hypothetical protein